MAKARSPVVPLRLPDKPAPREALTVRKASAALIVMFGGGSMPSYRQLRSVVASTRRRQQGVRRHG